MCSFRGYFSCQQSWRVTAVFDVNNSEHKQVKHRCKYCGKISEETDQILKLVTVKFWRGKGDRFGLIFLVIKWSYAKVQITINERKQCPRNLNSPIQISKYRRKGEKERGSSSLILTQSVRNNENKFSPHPTSSPLWCRPVHRRRVRSVRHQQPAGWQHCSSPRVAPFVNIPHFSFRFRWTIRFGPRGGQW